MMTMIILLPMTVSGVLPVVARGLLAVRGGVDDAPLALRRQLDGVGVVEAGDHRVVADGVVRLHVVVVERVGRDAHLVVVALVCDRLRRAPVRGVAGPVPFDGRSTWNDGFYVRKNDTMSETFA